MRRDAGMSEREREGKRRKSRDKGGDAEEGERGCLAEITVGGGEGSQRGAARVKSGEETGRKTHA